jgi:hypothetical protein
MEKKFDLSKEVLDPNFAREAELFPKSVAT